MVVVSSGIPESTSAKVGFRILLRSRPWKICSNEPFENFSLQTRTPSVFKTLFTLHRSSGNTGWEAFP